MTDLSGWISVPDLPWPAKIRVARRADGWLVCTGLILGDLRGGKLLPEITARDLRRIKLGTFLTQFGIPRNVGTTYAGPLRRPGPKGHPPEHFRQVADAYRRALLDAPRKPIKTLAQRLHTSEATARRWVRRAQAQGWL